MNLPRSKCMRRLQGFVSSGRDTRYCESPGCFTHTKLRKPFCTDHINQHSYVQTLLALIATRDTEYEKVLLHGEEAVDVEGLAYKEILSYLRVNGHRTFVRIAKDLSMNHRLLHGYIQKAKNEGDVKLYADRRGTLVIELI